MSMLNKVGIENLQDIKHTFTKEDIANCLDDSCWDDNITLLKEYYLPCKYRNYCVDVSEKKIITIIKQCLRVYNYKLESKEKYIYGKKHIIYYLKNCNLSNNKKEKECLVSFD
jgi:hypothetical protein